MWLALLAIVLVICLLLYLDTIKPKNFPPGPRWLPIVGSAIEVSKLREKHGYLFKAVDILSKKYSKDGAIMGLRIGKDKIVMINSLEINKEMFTNEDIEGRPKGIFYQTRTWGQRRGVLLTDGELWREQRRFLLKHLKEFGFGRRGMGDIACHEASCMIRDVENILKTKQPPIVYMHNFFNTYILNTLWFMMAGIRYNPTEPQMVLLQKLLFDLFSAVDMVGTAFSHFPILCVLAPTKSGFKDFVRTHKRIWRFLREEIAKHKENFNPEKEGKDFMDVYLRVLQERGEVDTYSEDQLLAICMDMFMAGTETTNKSMSFGFSYMVRDPSIQKKAQEEIDRVVGKDRAPNLDDRDNMPYCYGIVYESIRHFMARTFSVPHRATKDTKLAGYDIPEDTMVVNNFTRFLMDEELYPDPMEFKPERFIVDGAIKLPDHYFPFGLGKHRCLGDVLSKCNIFIFTTTILQKFTFLPLDGEMPSLRHVDGATASAAPFKARIVPRNISL
ncbi:probable cytochrome P450 303a1 [Plodia interpunctella]|uniref:probable cytochrome P450 303a1 n=1 Tax=Plodia interpunctella TaxID=58824 RepID=UPI0023688D60|nr:probable cytochrome P450 303a1 [Plodia interpunctella]XP_053623786.1 probable cytochrome P450 303a1 [Plodia interpunctella]